jgi:TRAP-type C4-dicarboxylate transport system permease small subunit
VNEQPHAVPEISEVPLPPTGPFLKILSALDNGLASVEKVLLVLLTYFMLGAVGIQVVGRLAGFSFPGAMEASVFAMLALSLIAGGVTMHYRRHISIDILSRLMPGSVRTVIAVLIDVVGFLLMALITKAAWFYVYINRTGGEYNSSALKIPFWWVQMLIPVAFGILAFRFFVFFFEDLKRILTRQWLPQDSHHHGVDIRM